MNEKDRDILGRATAKRRRGNAAWLLWKHTFVTRRVEGDPRGLSAEGDVNKRDLLNTVELRKECVAALEVEQKRVFDGLATTYPGEPISQSTLANGIRSTISAGAEKRRERDENHATLL